MNRILVFDNLADRTHDCDAILDCVYGRTADDYKSLVPEDVNYYWGQNMHHYVQNS